MVIAMKFQAVSLIMTAIMAIAVNQMGAVIRLIPGVYLTGIVPADITAQAMASVMPLDAILTLIATPDTIVVSMDIAMRLPAAFPMLNVPMDTIAALMVPAGPFPVVSRIGNAAAPSTAPQTATAMRLSVVTRIGIVPPVITAMNLERVLPTMAAIGMEIVPPQCIVPNSTSAFPIECPNVGETRTR
jgi:hypothetical protein